MKLHSSSGIYIRKNIENIRFAASSKRHRINDHNFIQTFGNTGCFLYISTRFISLLNNVLSRHPLDLDYGVLHI